MKLILLGLFALLASAKPNGNNLIKIDVRYLDPPCEPSNKHCPKSGAVPEIDIVFPDGRMDSLVLERHYASPEARIAGEKHCNFFGHLKNDASACVAVTGCYGQEDMEFTINSRDLETNMYILRKKGNFEALQSKLKTGEAKIRYMHLDGTEDDEMAEMEMKTKCAAGQCKSIPDRNLMKIKIGFEDSWIGSFGGSTSSSTSYINSMVTHMQSYFCLDSLGTKIQLETTGDYTHHAGHTWTAGSIFDDDLESHITPLTQASTADAHLWVYLAGNDFNGYGGLAWVGTLCMFKAESCSITEKMGNIVYTAEVVSHEMGHNMGMHHDHDHVHGGNGGPCDGKGFMSYGSHPQQWSTCSKNDFLAHYNTVVDSGSWCLPYASTACNSVQVQPPPPSSSPSPPSGCGFPEYKGDNYCDDENNNAGCEWDGGDCCGSNVNTQFCLVCECLDPDQGGGGPPSSSPSPPSPPSGCGYPEYKGDNYCDDENNNAGCEWDGGDCCGDNVNTYYCSVCECLDPNEQGSGGSTPPPPPPGCGIPEYKGDNYCDDENNNAGCEWDGGDCCGDNVNTEYCFVCECLDPNE